MFFILFILFIFPILYIICNITIAVDFFFIMYECASFMYIYDILYTYCFSDSTVYKLHFHLLTNITLFKLK